MDKDIVVLESGGLVQDETLLEFNADDGEGYNIPLSIMQGNNVVWLDDIQVEAIIAAWKERPPSA